MPAEGNPYTPDEMHTVLGFTVTIDNAGSGDDPDSAWETCTGGALNIEVADSSTGSDQFHTTTPGHKYVDTLTLRGPMTGDREDLMQWLNDAISGRNPRRDVLLDIENKGGNIQRSYNYYDCFPVRYELPKLNAGSTGTLHESVTLQAEFIEYMGMNEGGVSVIQDVSDVKAITNGKFSFSIEGEELSLTSCEPGGVEFMLEEAVGGDEPWDNKPGKGNEWVGGDEPWDNKPGKGSGAGWIGGDEPWENKPGKGSGAGWIGGDEPWENKPGKGKGSDWVGGDEPWDNKPGWGAGSDWVGGDEPWDNKYIWTQYELVDVEFGTWTIMREYDRTDLTLLIMYEEFASGLRLPSLEDKGSLTVYDEAGDEARKVDFFAYWPVKYEVVKVDAADGTSKLYKQIELVIDHAEYS